MALVQVGVVALRSPSGEFLPSVPILKELPEPTRAAEITEAELERIFIERFRLYKAACKKKNPQRRELSKQ